MATVLAMSMVKKTTFQTKDKLGQHIEKKGDTLSTMYIPKSALAAGVVAAGSQQPTHVQSVSERLVKPKSHFLKTREGGQGSSAPQLVHC